MGKMGHCCVIFVIFFSKNVSLLSVEAIVPQKTRSDHKRENGSLLDNGSSLENGSQLEKAGRNSKPRSSRSVSCDLLESLW